MPHRSFSIIVGGVIVVAALLLQFFVSSTPHSGTWLARVNALWYDLRFQLLPPERTPLMPIVIIDLDEFTQQREGRWPWDRAKVAQLVEALRGQGTALIGFDVVFSEPGGNAAQTVREQLQAQTTNKNHKNNAGTELELGQRGEVGATEGTDDLNTLANEVDLQALLQQLDVLSPQLDGDAVFAQHFGPDTVLCLFLHNDRARAGQLPPAPLLLDNQAPAPDLLQMNDYTANLAQLNFAMPASGFVVAIPDGDGIVRRMPLVMRHQNEVYNALSVEIVRLAIGAPWTRLQTQKINDAEVVLTGVNFGNWLKVPVDTHGQMLVPYRGRAGSFPTVSATRLLQGDAAPKDLEALQGAIALIGTSALGLADLRTTPLQTSYPGVEVHANVIDTMLHAFVHQDRSEERRVGKE